jgi:ferredoxin
MKAFINPPREKMLGGIANDQRPLILAGVKGCDLASLVLQDFVFQGGDYVDPFYTENRNKAILIGHDCTYARETCFCLAMEGAPYPQKYFDMNLSPIDDYFLVEIATDKARSLVNNFKVFFKDNSRRDLDARQTNRDRVCNQIKEYIDRRGTQNTSQIKGAVTKSYNTTELWQDFASTCVECGACNLVCPTCHCFLLFDEKGDRSTKRFRTWDACLYKTFAQVAGGANPRKHLYERLRNRFDKKFAFFPQVLNYFACTGCGRCIEACPGDIDLREVLKGCVFGKWNKPPND